MDLKDQIKQIVEIIALVPERFQEQCFDLLLKDALASRPTTLTASARSSSSPAAIPSGSPVQSQAPAEPGDEEQQALSGRQPKVNAGSDISLADLHMKTRKFMERHAVTVDELNNLFYKEGDGYQTLYTDLGVTGVSEGQMRIALLQCLHHSLTDGEFVASVEAVREECKMRKCYDLNNFASNFKKNAGLFDFGEWSKEVSELRLSEEGRKTLATVVKTVS
jgi:hypothetical protein